MKKLNLDVQYMVRKLQIFKLPAICLIICVVAKQYKSNRKLHDKTARDWTRRHAMKKAPKKKKKKVVKRKVVEID